MNERSVQNNLHTKQFLISFYAKTTVLIISCAFGTASLAQQSNRSLVNNGSGQGVSSPGLVYIGLGAGKASFSRRKDEAVLPDEANGVDERSETTGRVYAGYRINPSWSIELGYTRWGEFSFNNGQHDASVNTVSLSAKHSSLIDNEFILFFKLGAHKTTELDVFYDGKRVYDWKSDLIYGFGIEYPMGSSMDFRLEYERIGGPGNGLESVSGNLQYNY